MHPSSSDVTVDAHDAGLATHASSINTYPWDRFASLSPNVNVPLL